MKKWLLASDWWPVMLLTFEALVASYVPAALRYG